MAAQPTNGPASRGGETQDFDPRALGAHPLLGQMVANYHITGIIGQGGQGAVYRARDIKLDRNVALKVLRYPEDSTARAGLLREARALARIGTHAHIVPIYAWGELAENCYFALEHLPGSAADLLREHPEGLAMKQALAIAGQCAEALAHAHEKGLLHLDIKPANILLDGATAKLCDFGLARHYMGDGGVPDGTSGSPAYMAPELLRGDAPGPASDIFSLGVTTYQLLCGHLPFSGNTLAEIVENIQAGADLPLGHFKPQYPQSLAALLHRCMAVNPEDRFTSAAALADAIGELISPKTTLTMVRPPVRSIMVTVAALLAVVTGGIVIPLFLGEGGSALKTVEADGRKALEQGDYSAAASVYESLVTEHPGEDNLLYGLGYAQLLARNYAGAEAAFAQIQNKALAAEGRAATAQARHDRSVRPTLEGFVSDGGSAYASVLLAMSEISDGDYTQARDRLAQLDADRMTFDWQRARLWQALGQAHFRLGELAQARQAFEQAASLEVGPAAETASDYLAMTREELAHQEYTQLSAQISKLKSLRDAAPSAPEQDEWTSRPLRLWLPPATSTRSIVATESGLADVLPWKLSNALGNQEIFPIDIVDRNYTSAILGEQELSAQLSSEGDAVRLGKLLGARLALFCHFNTVLGEESLNAVLVDVETSQTIPLKEIPLDGSVEVTAWVSQVSDRVVEAVQESYPIRAIVLMEGDEATINIGEDHGVRPGMRMMLMTGPGREFAVPHAFAVVGEAVGRTTASVRLEGVDSKSIPGNGWFAEGLAPGEIGG